MPPKAAKKFGEAYFGQIPLISPLGSQHFRGGGGHKGVLGGGVWKIGLGGGVHNPDPLRAQVCTGVYNRQSFINTSGFNTTGAGPD